MIPENGPLLIIPIVPAGTIGLMCVVRSVSESFSTPVLVKITLSLACVMCRPFTLKSAINLTFLPNGGYPGGSRFEIVLFLVPGYLNSASVFSMPFIYFRTLLILSGSNLMNDIDRSGKIRQSQPVLRQYLYPLLELSKVDSPQPGHFSIIITSFLVIGYLF